MAGTPTGAKTIQTTTQSGAKYKVVIEALTEVSIEVRSKALGGSLKTAVVLKHSDGQRRYQATTDEKGRGKLVVPAGIYVCEAKTIGRSPAKPVQVAIGGIRAQLILAAN